MKKRMEVIDMLLGSVQELENVYIKQKDLVK